MVIIVISSSAAISIAPWISRCRITRIGCIGREQTSMGWAKYSAEWARHPAGAGGRRNAQTMFVGTA